MPASCLVLCANDERRVGRLHGIMEGGPAGPHGEFPCGRSPLYTRQTHDHSFPRVASLNGGASVFSSQPAFGKAEATTTHTTTTATSMLASLRRGHSERHHPSGPPAHVPHAWLGPCRAAVTA